jgi:DNA-binding XRE family transcriptional regulator
MKEIIKNNLSKYRIFLGLTQEQLAKELKISTNSVRNIEVKHHYPKYQIRSKICKYFNVSPNQMFFHPNFTIEKENCHICGDEFPKGEMYKSIATKYNQAEFYICYDCKNNN